MKRVIHEALAAWAFWLMVLALLGVVLFRSHPSHARDDGRFAGSPLKAWFDKLASGKGLCCSFADGVALEDPNWGTHEDHYWVILDDGNRYAVPAEALVTEPNKFGRAVVWPYTDSEGVKKIRCFLPGGGA